VTLVFPLLPKPRLGRSVIMLRIGNKAQQNVIQNEKVAGLKISPYYKFLPSPSCLTFFSGRIEGGLWRRIEKFLSLF